MFIVCFTGVHLDTVILFLDTILYFLVLLPLFFFSSWSYLSFFAHTAKQYHAFLASDSVIKQIPRLLGPGLNKAGKFPSPVSHQKSLEDQVREGDSKSHLVYSRCAFMDSLSLQQAFLKENTHLLDIDKQCLSCGFVIYMCMIYVLYYILLLFVIYIVLCTWFLLGVP